MHCCLIEMYVLYKKITIEMFFTYILPSKCLGAKMRSNRQTSRELCVTHIHARSDSFWVPSHLFAVRWVDCWGMRLRLSLEDLKWERSYCGKEATVRWWAGYEQDLCLQSWGHPLAMCLRGASTKWRRLGLEDGAPISLLLLDILKIEYSFISALFLYFFLVHPHLTWIFVETFSPVV